MKYTCLVYFIDSQSYSPVLSDIAASSGMTLLFWIYELHLAINPIHTPRFHSDSPKSFLFYLFFSELYVVWIMQYRSFKVFTTSNYDLRFFHDFLAVA